MSRPVPWHTRRTPLVDLAGALAAAACVGARRSALDVVLLAQTEVAEVTEADGRCLVDDAAQAEPDERDPRRRLRAPACPANALVLLESAEQEHERAAGAWHAEWHALATALAATVERPPRPARSLDGLRVDVARMRANITDETLSEARRLGIEVAGPADYLGAAGVFVDRALAL